MTARDELTALIAPGGVGLCPKTCRDTGKGQHAHDVLDSIARLATDPETAPVVFRWLLEAGVLADSGTFYCTVHNGVANEDDEVCDFAEGVAECAHHGLFYGEPWDDHYHAVLGER